MDPRTLSILDLTYHLPAERIAMHPLAERSATKLLVYRDGSIADERFHALPDHLPEGTLLVLNDTRVVKARITFQRTTGAVLECMVLTPEQGRTIEGALLDEEVTRWWCMVGNSKRWKGEELTIERDGQSLKATRVDQRDGEHFIEFQWTGGGPFLQVLERFGAVPLPPYMRREAEVDDTARYNTVFGERPGSVAAPTASLHFTDVLLDELAQRNVRSTRVTLHVGAGTFLPVKSATMEGHSMHSEQLRVPRSTVQALIDQLGKGPIVPVGTTALRTIESLHWMGAELLLESSAPFEVGQWRPYSDGPDIHPREALEALLHWMARSDADAITGSTRLLIAPGYRFRFADGVITNFHQPQSTLLLLVAALVGPDWHMIYDHALANGYRFLSYGDGSLLWAKDRPAGGY